MLPSFQTASHTMQPNPAEIERYLAEDIGDGDLTAKIVPEAIQASATVITREGMVVCGTAWFDAVFERLSPQLAIEWLCSDGDWAAADTVLCRLSGPARALLTGERTALNLLQTLSATASVAREYANAVAGTGCKVLDTRKTLPGLRLAQKYAVQCGGCFNHRIGLFDAILIKENHILAAGSIAEAVRAARSQANVPVEVEVENLYEFEQALLAKPDRVMLDNFSLPDLVVAVSRNQGQVELEASGNITLQNIRSVAETGVDFISIGALTKNIKAVDLSMRIDMRIG
ncbi:carboxylating nicotinate-nucleotide diphosphorylase [Methylomonas sp. SURF-1]|uniref:nicotinate-nucleotide diphosphorylase (carboxylating) n=2 Tax=Methylomonas aurea TaxID=2952224 RepID=A0ABT1UI91_9GAMM|nr:carboxylating nicotinate-nucleotide diphosphorylase [Methylomonas sp. SURF-1]MCQ8181958.1 carboxylating nicotinate-nucleotide diphosphorylase [Methylomonas sp. SURF-1]